MQRIRGHRALVRLLPIVVAIGATLPVGPAPRPASAQQATGGGRFQEVGRLPLVAGGTHTDTHVGESGWLILDPKNRLGYQVFEGTAAGTVVQSFDLDTLRLRRRLVLAGVPVTSGIGDVAAPATTQNAGEVVHAVDERTGRVYLAMSEQATTGPRQQVAASTGDGQRPLTRFVMIDGKAFDRGEARAVTSFKEPANHAPFHFFNVLNLTVTHHHTTAPDQHGKLLVTFAQPPPIPGNLWPAYGHVVAQWDVSGLRADAGDESGLSLGEVTAPPLVVPGESRVLESCGLASMGSINTFGQGTMQWELLATRTALYTVCQVTEGSSSVVEIPLGDGGTLVTEKRLRTFPLAKPVSDVMADPGGERLLVKAVEFQGNIGVTLWVFDVARGGFTGAVALKQALEPAISVGINPATGRVYALGPDYGALVGGKRVATRGGIQITDSRLDPAPPLENIAPEEAYPAIFRIKVDAPTGRVFARRGHGKIAVRTVYPDTEPNQPAVAEPFYRVYKDRIPVAEQPPEIEDAAFTTDVAESELTRASYQGDGSGFGSRALLIGGIDAATTGATARRTGGPGNYLEWPCGSDDRELVAGAVNSVSVSDLSTTAEAAALDADARTRRVAPDLADACGPRIVVGNSDPTGGRTQQSSTEQAAFDEPTGKDLDGDGRIDRTGENHYAATCLGDDGTRRPRGFSKANAKTGRESFDAQVTCDQAHDKAEGRATGALSPAATFGAPPDLGDPVRVAHSDSTVTVKRVAGKGIEVKVDSIARGVDIAGVGTISVVRAEATSTATGRGGRAGGTFTRTICGVNLGSFNVAGCLEGSQRDDFVTHLNTALGTRGRARLRQPDAALAKGSESGYRAAVQRDRNEQFEDRSITRDNSSAVPGLEIMFFQGDGDARWGTGRQVFQLAGVQAATSYGITCLYGQLGNGRCAKAGEGFGAEGGGTTTVVVGPDGTVTETITMPGATTTVPAAARPAKESRLKTVLYAAPRAIAQALRLLFNNPRELGLMAAVWALLYAPCYLGERRRSIRGLRARRAAVGLGGVA